MSLPTTRHAESYGSRGAEFCIYRNGFDCRCLVYVLPGLRPIRNDKADTREKANQ